MGRIKHIVQLWSNRFSQAGTILRDEGVAALLIRAGNQARRLGGMDYQGYFDRGYRAWRKRNLSAVGTAGSTLDEIALLSTEPSFSIIVPVHDVKQEWLAAMIQSVIDQVYPHWQLCLVDDASDDPEIRITISKFADDDARIKYRFNQDNQGIALTSNDALALATGDYITLLDHDDTLSEDALLQMATAINAHPGAELFYSDEDKISPDGRYETPFFKPDFSPELLESQNYFGHLVVIKKSAVDNVGGFSAGLDGAQDYDLILRVVENAVVKSTDTVVHIPRVLYHWRRIAGSTAVRFSAKSYAWEAGRLALQQHCLRSGIEAEVMQGSVPGTYRVKRRVQAGPRVSVIIPFRDQPDMLDTCLKSLFAHTGWSNLEIIAIDNGSSEPETVNTMARWQRNDSRIRFRSYPHEFNFSAICNLGVELAEGDYVVLMNNDIEIISPDWIEVLLEHAQRKGIGAVGARLVYPDRRIQHAGIVVGIGGCAGHPHKTFPADHIGYYGRLKITSNVSAVSAALLMVNRQKYLAVDGFDQTELTVAYNDVDFCLKLLDHGWRNIYTPWCEAIHHESVSRGYEVSAEQKQRHDREKQTLQDRWAKFFQAGDPCYNPNLTLEREDYTLNFKLDSLMNGSEPETSHAMSDG